MDFSPILRLSNGSLGELISLLFTDNFIRSLVNHSSAGDRYLNKAAKKCVLLYLIPDLPLAIYNPLSMRSTSRNHADSLPKPSNLLPQIRPPHQIQNNRRLIPPNPIHTPSPSHNLPHNQNPLSNIRRGREKMVRRSNPRTPAPNNSTDTDDYSSFGVFLSTWVFCQFDVDESRARVVEREIVFVVDGVDV